MASGEGKLKVVGKTKKNGDKRRALGESNVTPNLSAITAGGKTGPDPTAMYTSNPSMSVPINSTVYELGFEKIMKKQNKEQVPPSSSSSEPQPNKKQQNSGKGSKRNSGGSAAPGQGKFPTLEEAIRALDLAGLQREMEKSQSVFPENPHIWVMDLASYLNFKLQTVKNEPLPLQQSHDYPYCLVNKELKSIIRSVLSKASSVLDLLVDNCIRLMLEELEKPTADCVHGYRICIQAVLLDKPRTAFNDTFLFCLCRMHSNLTKGFGMIGPKDFFPLLDFAFMPNNSLTSSQQEQLRDLYPRLKVLAFGATPEKTLHTYFPSFLSRATPNCPPSMKKELLNSLYECLNVDPLSFSVWRQLYTKHLPQSSLLLQHLVSSWETTSKPVRKAVRETVQSFCVTNEEFSAKSSHSKDIEVCQSVCQALLQKMKGRGFPWFRLCLIVLVFLSGFLIHDVRTSGSIQASSSVRILQQMGVLSVSQQAWSKVSHYALQGQSWLERNVPVYYAQAVEVLGPGLEVLWEKSRDGTIYIAQILSTYLVYLRDNFPGFIQWVRAQIPDSVYQFLDYLQELLLLVYHNYIVPATMYCMAALQRAWQQYIDSCNGEVTWHCTRDHLSSITQSSWTFVQNTTLAIKDWAVAMMSSH
uniref:Transmembrane protein 214 n=1 Tax=Pyxicephalus adspersus TaxID=30357 RepID=A0AAV3AK89_PYXAD|nr:TPA: hypothetical protein GDO54_009991 [Pyxicephalus adspersus]